MWEGPVHKWPWWWTRVLLLEKRFASIREMAALSIDGYPPPKDFWLDNQKLEVWREDQDAMRKQAYG